MTRKNEYAHGVLIVHSTPSVLAPHIEWQLASEIGKPVSLQWLDQPCLPDTVRTEAQWRAPVGTAARVASQLLGWRGARFEITEFATAESEGGRWIHTPSLGVLHQRIDRAGNTVVTETQLRDCMTRAKGNFETLQRLVGRTLGEPWDRELDAFRAAAYGETAEITRLNRTVS